MKLDFLEVELAIEESEKIGDKNEELILFEEKGVWRIIYRRDLDGVEGLLGRGKAMGIQLRNSELNAKLLF